MKKKIVLAIICLIAIKTEAQTSIFNVVDSLMLTGNYQKALVVLENEQDKSVAVFDRMGGIYQSVGNYNKAIENYQQALKVSESAVIKAKLGKVYELSGLTSNAILMYEQIIQKDSTNLIVVQSLGKLYLNNFKAQKAELLYRYLKKKDSLNPNYPYQLGQSLMKQKRFLEMGQSYLDAYNIDTLHVKSIFKLAKFFKDIKDRDSTLIFINKGLEIDANKINFNQLKANVLYTTKDYKGAIKYITILDSLHYSTASTYEMLGMSYYKLDEKELALKSFEKALDKDRNNSKILFRKATVQYDLKQFEQAKFSLFMSIFVAKPDIDKQYFLLGIIYKEAGELIEAIRSFEKSFKNNPNHFKALYELAIAEDTYYKDKSIALKHYQKYLDKFESKDTVLTKIVNYRVKEIKTTLFIDGEKIEE